jgi:class 3 adenylate cyclase
MCTALGNDVYAREMRAPHCRRIRDLIAAHNGHENGTAGDSFMIVFQHADDALACVAGIQKALAEPPITCRDAKGTDWTVRVRIGVHTAEVQFRPNERGDYVGRVLGLEPVRGAGTPVSERTREDPDLSRDRGRDPGLQKYLQTPACGNSERLPPGYLKYC